MSSSRNHTPFRSTSNLTRILHSKNETNLSARVGRDHGVGIANGSVHGSGILHNLANEGKVEVLTLSLLISRHPRDGSTYLSTDNASLTQSTLHCVVEGIGIQTFGRTYELAVQNHLI